MPIPTFDDFVEENSLTVLTPDQKSRFLQMIHSYMASAGGVAFNDSMLVIRGGNLEYYAGLEYSQNEKVFSTPLFMVWEDSGRESNVSRLIRYAQEVCCEEAKSL
jgi:hypothetical protein